MSFHNISNLLLKRRTKYDFLIYDNIYTNYELLYIVPLARVKFKNNWFGRPKFIVTCFEKEELLLEVIEVNFGVWLLKDNDGKYGYVVFYKKSNKIEKFFYVAETFRPTVSLKNLYQQSSSNFYQSKSSLSNEYILHFPKVIDSVKNFCMRDNSLFFAKLDKNLFGLAYQNTHPRLAKLALGISLAVYGFTKI